MTPAPLPLPPGISLLDAAQLLAAAATIAALAVAWLAYSGDVQRSGEEERQGIRNVLTALEPELDLVRGFARGPEGQGYPPAPGAPRGVPPDEDVATHAHYHELMPEWRNPLRAVRPLICPAIAALQTSRYLTRLAPLVRAFGLLNMAIHSLNAAEHARADFVNANGPLVTRMRRIWLEPEQGDTITPDETDLMEIVFLQNYTLHVQLIGWAESADINALHRAYQNARDAFDQFRATWEASLPQPPRWHRVADAFSPILLGVAGLITLLLLWKALEPLPTMLWRTVAR